MCTGAILLYRIPRVVIGENSNFRGEEDLLRSRGVDVIVLDNEECKDLMLSFIQEHPEVRNPCVQTIKAWRLSDFSLFCYRNGMKISEKFRREATQVLRIRKWRKKVKVKVMQGYANQDSDANEGSIGMAGLLVTFDSVQ